MGGQLSFQKAILFPMTVCVGRYRPEERKPVRRAITKNGGSRYTTSLCRGFNRHSGCRRFLFPILEDFIQRLIYCGFQTLFYNPVNLSLNNGLLLFLFLLTLCFRHLIFTSVVRSKVSSSSFSAAAAAAASSRSYIWRSSSSFASCHLHAASVSLDGSLMDYRNFLECSIIIFITSDFLYLIFFSLLLLFVANAREAGVRLALVSA